MPKEPKKKVSMGRSTRHAPLGQVMHDDETRGRYAVSRKSHMDRRRDGGDRDGDDGGESELLDERTSRRILELSRDQQREVEEEEAEAQRRDHLRSSRKNDKQTKKGGKDRQRTARFVDSSDEESEEEEEIEEEEIMEPRGYHNEQDRGEGGHGSRRRNGPGRRRGGTADARSAAEGGPGLHRHRQAPDALHVGPPSQGVQGHTVPAQLGGGAVPHPAGPLDSPGHVRGHPDLRVEPEPAHGTAVLQPGPARRGPRRHTRQPEAQLPLLHGPEEERVQARGVLQGDTAAAVPGGMHAQGGGHRGERPPARVDTRPPLGRRHTQAGEHDRVQRSRLDIHPHPPEQEVLPPRPRGDEPGRPLREVRRRPRRRAAGALAPGAAGVRAAVQERAGEGGQGPPAGTDEGPQPPQDHGRGTEGAVRERGVQGGEGGRPRTPWRCESCRLSLWVAGLHPRSVTHYSWTHPWEASILIFFQTRLQAVLLKSNCISRSLAVVVYDPCQLDHLVEFHTSSGYEPK
ncbi:hypothetical protein THAOC_33259 [Thalassiosira oceanica]|uniref:Uncharacterized protein n=1 Tax=Thalassiosira oceanica TaxID=159749 RepID=K0RML8_THAOC|nr:hypothetical protein THAOC_33259 [Thalassiosira oceanica]|eukprot:EJK47982.1 hypothetical protein THAOC_33259 [Thalassiosira oceanica]